MYGEDTFDSFSLHDSPDSKGLPDPTPFLGDDRPAEYLDALLLPFHDLRLYGYFVSYRDVFNGRVLLHFSQSVHYVHGFLPLFAKLKILHSGGGLSRILSVSLSTREV